MAEAETMYAEQKGRLDDDYHAALDELTGAGKNPNVVGACIEYVTTAATQEDAADAWDVNVQSVRQNYKETMDALGADGVVTAPNAKSNGGDRTGSNTQDLATIKIPEFTDADPEALTSADDPIDGYEFDADHYDPDAVHGFYLHRARREALGLNWLEYLNAATPDIPEPSAAAIERAVSGAVGNGDGSGISQEQFETLLQAIDDLSADMREAAYHGSAEAIQDAR